MNLLTQWARLFVGSLARAGVRDVVVSPGSRSTPWLAAVLAEERLRPWQVIDERAAGFVALGQARATGRPSLLLCTSGSAAGHYLPAVIEAHAARVPMIVVSADRPAELQGCGASQTIDQTRLFGVHAAFRDLGAPDGGAGSLRALRRVAAQVVEQAGVVHVNAPAREPLEPRVAETEAERALEMQVTRLLEEGPPDVMAARAVPYGPAIEALAERCLRAERGVVVAGPAPVWQVADGPGLARRLGWPLLAEATSQQRGGGAPGEIEALRPDVVVQLGAAPIARGFQRWAASATRAAHVVIADHWSDPQSSATQVLLGDPVATVAALVAALPARERAPWITPPATVPTAEARLVGAAVAATPAGAFLAVGNSRPVRHLDAVGGTTLAVLSQRGAAGIDGLLAGALGSSAATGRPITLVLGDVSLQHDIASLGLAGLARGPLAVVVVNNDGGRIFEELPVARTVDAAAFNWWTTPHGRTFENAARQWELPYARVVDEGAVGRAVAAAHARGGVSIIEIDTRSQT